jgi:hypothetical protein
MRREDLATLQLAYSESTTKDERFPNSVGVIQPGIRKLQREVFADFDETRHGVGWWAPHPGTSRRILISDHLLQCITSIEVNLVEARLHMMELRDCDEREDRFMAHAIRHDREGKRSIDVPPRVRPIDDLPHIAAAINIAGFFRAIGSALDCLGAVIVGVLALPTSIVKADLKSVLKIPRKATIPRTDGEKLQAAFRDEMTRLVANLGPCGWLDWAVDYRYMLVHRGRRFQAKRLARRGAVLFSAYGEPVVLASAIQQLAQDPGLSDVEVLSTGVRPVIEEDATTTLEGLMSSALVLSDRTADNLLDVWASRRATPTLICSRRSSGQRDDPQSRVGSSDTSRAARLSTPTPSWPTSPSFAGSRPLRSMRPP